MPKLSDVMEGELELQPKNPSAAVNNHRWMMLKLHLTDKLHTCPGMRVRDWSNTVTYPVLDDAWL